MKQIRVRVKEMTSHGWAVKRRGENRRLQLKVEFDNGVVKWYPFRKIIPVKDQQGEIIRREIVAPEYVSMWSRFLNYFGLKKNKPSVS